MYGDSDSVRAQGGNLADMASDASERSDMLRRYGRRRSRLVQALRAPVPLVHNSAERHLPSSHGPKLLIGGAGSIAPEGFFNVDLVAFPGVHAVADIHALPFRSDSIAAIECDAVLEHVRRPQVALCEMKRVLQPGGHLHLVVPFSHPFHEYPSDYHRWTLNGLVEMIAEFDIVDVGVRTGPTATLLTYLLEYVKFVAPRGFGSVAYALAGWCLWPLRYVDLLLNRRSDAHRLANSIYALVRKRDE